MTEYIELVNIYLKEYVDSIENDKLRDAIEYSLFPGGKRLRPILLLSVLHDRNIDLQMGVYQACAIEMIHSYSLIHDDLPAMDNDDFRRGKPTVHRKYGEALAILAADALLTDAFAYFCKGNLDDSIKNKIVQLGSINAGSQGMVLGQVLDITTTCTNLSLEDVERIHLHKTKDLINLSLVSGGLIANFSEEELKLLEQLTYYFGLAFQIKDDIDDYSENGSDIINEKATYPIVLGLEKSKELLSDFKNKSLQITKELFKVQDLYELIERIL